MGRRARLRKEELFHHLGYESHPAQLSVHRSKASRRIVAAGVRVGKSTIGVHEAIAALLEPRERSLGWLVAPTYELTRRIFARVVATMHERMLHRIVKFEPREHRLVVANLGGGTSELRAKSADSSVSLLGEAIDFAIVDEAAQLKAEVWEEHLGPRLLDRRGWALLLSTPNGGGWFHQMFRRGQRGRDADFASWSMPTSENPHVQRDLIDAEQKRLPGDVFRAQYLGEFVGVPVEQCETCGGPSETMVPVIIMEANEPVPTCKECGDLVNAQGRTIVPMHDGQRGSPTIIRVMPSIPPPGMPDMEPEGRELPD